MLPSLRQIRYFIAAAETGQISQAAMGLHVSQSAITTAIKGLEEILGTRLFDRQSHGVILTYDGHRFLQHAHHILNAVQEAVRLPSLSNASDTGLIRLAVSFTVAGYFLPSYLARFARSFPNIKVELQEADRKDIEEGLISGNCDLAMILTSNLDNQEDLQTETLLRSRRRLWLSSDNEITKMQSVTLEDIADQPYIMLTVDEASNTALRYWNQTTHMPNVIFRTSSVEAVRSMVSNGTGISILSDMVYRPWSLEGRRIEVMTIAEEIPSMDVGLAWARGSARSKATKAFCEFMHLAVGSGHPHMPSSKR
ncbi:MAG: LysR family transcriptional regulator [Sneathiella sp.]|nr:LysR family transcriptional regulator [Sneathiella sp.]